MERETHEVKAGDYLAHLTRLGTNDNGEVVVLFHGYFEDGRIFIPIRERDLHHFYCNKVMLFM
jgi:hypothetical protein